MFVHSKYDSLICKQLRFYIFLFHFGVNTIHGVIPATPGSSTSNIAGGSVRACNFKHFSLIGEGEKKIKSFNEMGKTLIFKFEDVGLNTGVNPITRSKQAIQRDGGAQFNCAANRIV
ncbi:hypothetical protein FQR65_LT14621 [Abscondita terminalis]|nr:hypothetical protein FQR65_LT14621 [Abscondita terminalis]